MKSHLALATLLLAAPLLAQTIPPTVKSEINLDLNYDDIQPFGDPLQTNVAGAERTTFYPTVQATARRFGLAIVPDSKPASTTAPITSPSPAPASPPSPSAQAPSTPATMPPGPRQTRRLHRPPLPQHLRQLHARYGLHRRRQARPLRHGARLASHHLLRRHLLATQRRVRAGPPKVPHHALAPQSWVPHSCGFIA